ncbi:hypothetical protein [Piscinibacter sakaiensis]
MTGDEGAAVDRGIKREWPVGAATDVQTKGSNDSNQSVADIATGGKCSLF